MTTVEIREITPPRDVQDAMNRQLSAERTRRAVITESEGTRQATINVAEGDKQSNILRAEGDRQSAILRAEGFSQALERIYGAASGVDQKTMALQYLDALKALGASPSTKYIIPLEFTQLIEPFTSYVARSMQGDGGSGAGESARRIDSGPGTGDGHVEHDGRRDRRVRRRTDRAARRRGRRSSAAPPAIAAGCAACPQRAVGLAVDLELRPVLRVGEAWPVRPASRDHRALPGTSCVRRTTAANVTTPATIATARLPSPGTSFSATKPASTPASTPSTTASIPGVVTNPWTKRQPPGRAAKLTSRPYLVVVPRGRRSTARRSGRCPGTRGEAG